ncbi:SPOR domain-containing protein [Novosphingobium huizhouense]|uniref:SPOR domain-containing protein n=1 Tax=Novosphingobium huizhouense TaxID=2866625 RepID=UPI001CD8B020|nr:SPOR domain-containing protein [Novosphingobium huizhouense]
MRRPIAFLALPAFATALVLATPALADVRAGVEAWTRGDYARAVKEWQGPAAKGDADAQFDLAQAYKLGRGVAPDLAKAEQYYRAAAEQGHARAADNYGLLLFQSGRQAEAMPWLEQSAERGEPRAQYLVGVAAFNGDFAKRDWVRAYALLTRAAASDLPQALSGLATMNQTIPLDQRQQGVALAGELQQREERARAIQLGGADLAARSGLAVNEPAQAAPASAAPSPAPPAPPTPPVPAPEPPRPVRVVGEHAVVPPYQSDPTRPVAVGADYAGAVVVPPRAVRGAATGPGSAPPTAANAAAAGSTAARPAAPRSLPVTGPWRVQLGAFASKANADALWARARTRPEIVGRARIDLSAQGVTRLQAGGYASEAEAARACSGLKAADLACLVTKP